MNIALLFNIARKKLLKNKPKDILAGYDDKKTIKALKEAIEKNKHEVILIEADRTTYKKLKENKEKIDLVFNDVDESISKICEKLNIPYTGPPFSVLSTCLNKAKAKEILLRNKIATPKFQFFRNKDEKLNANMKFPLILKLNGEGSKMGLTKDSVVTNEEQLKKKLDYLFKTYKGEVIVEEYLTGREFTVGVIGNEEPIVFPPIEIKFLDNLKPEEKFLTYNSERGIEYINICPAPISWEFESKLKETALKAYKALGCVDLGRVDIRLDKDGNINVLEINSLPGIGPDFWFPYAAKEIGFKYYQLIGKIIEFAAERCNIPDLLVNSIPIPLKCSHSKQLVNNQGIMLRV